MHLVLLALYVCGVIVLLIIVFIVFAFWVVFRQYRSWPIAPLYVDGRKAEIRYKSLPSGSRRSDFYGFSFSHQTFASCKLVAREEVTVLPHFLYGTENRGDVNMATLQIEGFTLEFPMYKEITPKGSTLYKGSVFLNESDYTWVGLVTMAVTNRGGRRRRFSLKERLESLKRMREVMQPTPQSI